MHHGAGQEFAEGAPVVPDGSHEADHGLEETDRPDPEEVRRK